MKIFIAMSVGLFVALGAMISMANDEASIPTKEVFAFVRMYEYLDGPRLEAMGGKSSNLAWDDKGNMYFFSSFGYGAIRCCRTDGRIVTISGNDYWNPTEYLPEGPASSLGAPTGGRGYHYSYATGDIAVQGIPEDGEDKGCIYVSGGIKGFVRVFRNKAKGNRWWFERIAGAGKAKAPTKRGQSVVAKDVALGRVHYLQFDLDEKLWLFAKGAFFHYKDGELTCILGPDDYLGKGGPGPEKPCKEGYMGGDGSFYLGTYLTGEGYGATGTAVYRVTISPDEVIKVVPYARAQKRGVVLDGDAMTEASWHCGPHFAPGWNATRYQPANVLIVSANDEAALRRIVDGRTSTLCNDGEWRELVGKRTKTAPLWFHGWRIGPNSTGYQFYSGGDWAGECRLYRITGFDLSKPTVK